MITSLSGTIKDIAPQVITLYVHSIGFSVAVPDERLFTINQTIELSIYFHWNQETGPQLFGFTTALSKTIFMLVISCSGLGPKMGLTVLAHMSPEQFLQAITLADTKALSSISGIGAKKAELMIMHLKDKVAKIVPNDNYAPENASLIKVKQVADVLSSLNYSRQEINGALEHVKKNYDIEKSAFDELLRKTLAFLAKRTM